MKQSIFIAFIAILPSFALAQPFTPNGISLPACGTTYNEPCPGGYMQGFSAETTLPTGTSIDDIHGSDGLGEHHAVGNSSQDIAYTRRNSVSGAILDVFTLDVFFAIHATSGNEYVTKMTVDEANMKAYYVGWLAHSTYDEPYLVQVDISSTPTTLDWAVSLPYNTTGGAVDLALDGGYVYVLTNDAPSTGDVYNLYKIDPSSPITPTASYTSAFSFEAQGARMKIDDGNGYIYVAGVFRNHPSLIPDGGLIAKYNMSFIPQASNIQSGVSYTCLDINYSGGNADPVVAGYSNTPGPNGAIITIWTEWPASLTSLTGSYTSSSNGSSSNGDIPWSLLVDPNGQYIMLMQMPFNNTTVGDFYLTYVDKVLSPDDIHYGMNAYKMDEYFASGGDFFGMRSMHKDSDGSIIVGGNDATNNYSIIGKFDNPSCTTWNDYENKSATVGKLKLAGNSFNLYPNPANSMLTIQVNEPAKGIYQYRIMNTLGQLVKQNNIGNINSEFNCNISELNAGNYYLQLLQNDEPIGTHTFRKE